MTTAFGEEWRSTLQEIGVTAQRALQERPSVSIRMRVVLGFVLWFVLSLGLAIVSIITVSRIQEKLHFLQATDNYTFEIQQARRFEKNYFLYQTNLENALEHVHNARRILRREKANIANVVGDVEYQTMGSHLSRYEDLLLKLKEDITPASIAAVEAELREHGAEMVTVAEELVEKERKTVNAMLVTARRIPMAFFFVIILSTAYFAAVIARQVFAPLKRLVSASRRIADGDLTPIQPAKTYRDEFSDLAIAMNHMLLHLLKRHEMLLQAHKLKAVGTLTAGVAHELNNPINNIMLSASMLYEDYDILDDGERKDMANDMVMESERAQKIVRNLLDFARESGMESEQQDIQDIIENTLRLASNQIKLSNVKIKGELIDNPPPIFVDRRQVEQVFLNIVLNALDAMPNGGTLTICCDNAQGNEFISVDFTDTGTGIPEEKLTDIFNPFFTTKPDAKGTGLGLSVSLGIIKQHGGDIKVKSKVGEGTTFTVLLPVAQFPAAIPNDH